MPPRYNQGQLASQVVGTPGYDQSAGQASLAAAKAMDEMTTTANSLALQNGRQAIQSFESAGNALMYYGQQAAAEARRKMAIQKAEDDEARRLQVQFDRIDEDNRMDSTVANLKTQYAQNPEGALEAFNKQVPIMRQEFQDRYSKDEKRLRMLMPSQLTAINAVQTHLNAWAKETHKQNLNARLLGMPEELGQKIDTLSGDMNDQLLGFQKHLLSTDGVYKSIADGAVTDAEKSDINTKRMNMGNAASARFVDHLFAQVPDGEDGMKYLNNLKSLIGNAQKLGVPLSSSDQKTAMEHVHSQYNIREGEVITGIKNDSDLALLDTNSIKARLYQAADNPRELERISTDVKNRYTKLKSDIEMVSKEPDSKVKTAKISALKQQQNSLTSELGLDLKLVRQFDQLQRTLVSFARSTVTYNQGQERRLMMLSDRAYMMEQRAQRADAKAAHEADAARLENFNKSWAGVQNDMQAALAQPVGAKQQAAVSKVIREKAIPSLNSAVQTGLISGEAYGARLEALKATSKTAALTVQTPKQNFGPFSWGGETKKLKGKELEKAMRATEQGVASAISTETANFRALGHTIDQLKTLTRSKAEKAYMETYLGDTLPRVFQTPKYRAMNDEQKAAARAAFTKQALIKLRQGTLK